MENNDAPSQISKRPRPIVSCLSCRNRKLACSRTLPCNKCIKGGRASTCEYAPGQEPIRDEKITGSNGVKRPRIDDSTIDQSSIAANTRFDELQTRVQQLEQALTFQRASPQSQGLSQSESRIESPAPNSSFVYPAQVNAVVNSQTFSDRSTVSQFEAVREFVDKLGKGVPIEELPMIASDIHHLYRKTTVRQTERFFFHHYSNVEDILAHMERLLPPITTCNILTECYFNYFENSTRVLHRGTTWTQIRAYFNNSLIPGKRTACLPMLIAIVSIASSLGTFPECDCSALHGEIDGIGAYQLIRNYLELLTEKEWKELSSLQLAVLTLKFHKSSPLNDHDTWHWSGQIVRRAMTARLQFPEHNNRSVFETEIKRRLWLTILEFDLTLSISSGMPINCPMWQGNLPVNINDNKLYPGILDLPASRSTEAWTDGICQHVLAQSLNDRITAYNAICLGGPAMYSTVLEHTRHLEQIIRDLPSPFRLGPGSDEASDTPHRLMAKMELDFLLRRPLIACYAPYAALMPADDKYKDARIPWIQGSTIGVCFQDLFDPKYPTLDLPEPRGLWDYFYNVYRWDVEQYMLANCLELQRLRSLHLDEPDVPSAAFYGHTSRTPVKVMGWSIDSITKSLDETLDPLIRRIGRHGSCLREVVIWTAVMGSLRVNPTCSREHAIKNELQSLISVLKGKLPGEAPGQDMMKGFHSDPRMELQWLQRFFLHAETDSPV